MMDAPEIVGEVLKLLGALVVGILGTWLTVRLQRRTRVIQYESSVFRLVRLDPAHQTGVQVLVDKSLLTGKETDLGQTETVEKLAGISIKLENIGNEVAEDITAVIELPPHSRILQTLTKPEPTDAYPIKITRAAGPGNRATLHIPYLNERECVLASLTVAGLDESRGLQLSVLGKGVEARPRRLVRELLSLAVRVSILIGVMSMLSTQTFLAWLPPGLRALIGARIVTQETVTFTTLSQFIFRVLFLGVIFAMARPVLRENEPPPPWRFH